MTLISPEPLDYWKFADVKSVQAVGYDAFKRSFAFQINTSEALKQKPLSIGINSVSSFSFAASDMIRFSVECSDQPDWNNIVAAAPPNWLDGLVSDWVAHIESLLFFNRMLASRFQPPHSAHPRA